MHYDAIVTKQGKHYLITFPDCPGCQTFADCREEILPTAQDALEGWLEAQLLGGGVPPTPSARKRARAIHVNISARLGFAVQVRIARQQAKLTQRALAKRARVSQQQIAKLEDPDANLTIDSVVKVAKALGKRATIDLKSA